VTLKDQLDALLDATAFDSTGTKIGAVRQVYVDDATGKITFATVSTGIFSSDAIVPLHGARLLDEELHLDHTRSVIRDSPRPDRTEDGLTPDQESTLLEHYGIEPQDGGRETAAPEPEPEPDPPAEPEVAPGKKTTPPAPGKKTETQTTEETTTATTTRSANEASATPPASGARPADEPGVDRGGSAPTDDA